MSPRDRIRASQLEQLIVSFQETNGPLPGILSIEYLRSLVYQLIDSIRRIEFAHYIRDAPHHPSRMDPNSELFDPLRAAVLHNRNGNTDEAWWLVFMATHFGKHPIDGWRLTRDIYGKLGQGCGLWDWPGISHNPIAFKAWLENNEDTLRGGDGVSRRFSNHRKYESLKARSNKGTAAVLISYVNWITPPRRHAEIVRELHQVVGQNPHQVFAALYKSMDSVLRFGRLGKFDFLAMLGKLDIAPVAPGSTFLSGATGPLAGARLLFCADRNSEASACHLEEKLVRFSQYTNLPPQALEDAICNWQKSPHVHKRFRG
ncbi:hypothetical protein [Zavarzinia sp.]|uniref:alpha-glutamyl/putrescinyl thymine pyrophosphorylase clade 3 protein n=1 Tax=Zavarzinia sp. TaxID=2027920 RepID=UPI003BB5E531